MFIVSYINKYIWYHFIFIVLILNNREILIDGNRGDGDPLQYQQGKPIEVGAKRLPIRIRITVFTLSFFPLSLPIPLGPLRK